MSYSLAEARKRAEEEGLIGTAGNYLKLKEGDNRLRLLSMCLPHASYFKEKKTFKWLCYILDRKDGVCKPFFMGHRIYKQIEALQMNPDYEFFDVPMPYDLTINARGAGTMEVVYTVMPARQNRDLTTDEMKAFHALPGLIDLQRKIKEKATEKAEPTDSPPSDTDFDPGDFGDL